MNLRSVIAPLACTKCCAMMTAVILVLMSIRKTVSTARHAILKTQVKTLCGMYLRVRVAPECT